MPKQHCRATVLLDRGEYPDDIPKEEGGASDYVQLSRSLVFVVPIDLRHPGTDEGDVLHIVEPVHYLAVQPSGRKAQTQGSVRSPHRQLALAGELIRRINNGG